MQSHPKTRRLLKREEFRRLFNSRQKYFGRAFSIEFLIRKDINHPRLGITVTRQYGKSNLRNLFKRRIKEIFRHHSYEIDFGIDINIRAKNKIPHTFQVLEQDFKSFLASIRSKQQVDINKEQPTYELQKA